MSQITVCLDAGHYGSTYNQSTEVAGYYESEMAWQLHLYLKAALEEYGCVVKCTRSEQNSDLAVYDRGACAKGCDLFLSLHSNACGTESVDYPIIYRAYDNCNNADAVALGLVEQIAEKMGTVQGGKTGTRTTTSGTEYYGVMRGARAVGCPMYLLIEHSFHTNKEASLWLLDKENLQSLAKLEADYIAAYYGMTKGEEDCSDYTVIMGSTECTVAQMEGYLSTVNPDAQSYLPLAQMFYEQGAVEGVRGDIAFAQACLETGNFKFGGDVLPEQNNFCGLGATGNGEAGLSFATMEEGATAQVQHLKAYACEESLVGTCVDPRFGYVSRGCAEYVEWLGIQENPQGKGWAAGADYGAKILAIIQKIKEVEVMETIPTWMEPALDWMTEEELMAGDGNGNLRVNETLTRGEFAVMLYAYHKKMNP